MKPNPKRPCEVADLGIEINAEWSDGPRTPAWDRLWRIILSELDPKPATTVGGRPGAGGDHA
jgi:hypothetical protein